MSPWDHGTVRHLVIGVAINSVGFGFAIILRFVAIDVAIVAASRIIAGKVKVEMNNGRGLRTVIKRAVIALPRG